MRLRRIRRPGRPRLQKRYEERRTPSGLVEQLSEEDLRRLNELLPWRCFTVDTQGRPLGGTAWRGKRDTPEAIPDPRIERLHARFDLSDKHVLEIGCFEGVHTIALCRLAGRVTAVDARIENVVKTIVRCALFEVSPRVFVQDVEDTGDEVLHADVCHHVGVLYHLEDPVGHLRRLGTWIARGMMLDTHYATDTDATETYEVAGDRFRYRPYRELGRADVFSGVRPSSRWLRLDDIVGELQRSGFDTVEVVEERHERNGPRALIFAERS
jgi:tRNA (mo5U34)-methyltransferase